jgi:hypothetical protein
MEGWMDVWKDGWIDGCMDEHKNKMHIETKIQYETIMKLNLHFQT